MIKRNETHDPSRNSWVRSANGDTPFPIQNLPFGVFQIKGDDSAPRCGVAIGREILDVSKASSALGLAGLAAQAAACMRSSTLNALAALGRPHWQALRLALSRALSQDTPVKRQQSIAKHLIPMSRVNMHLPVTIGDFTDFYTSSYHATNVGRLFRPDNPLMPNFKWIPVAYHGRSSSVVVSGTPIRRPNGQTKAPDAATPRFGPTQRLDYEVELGLIVGPGNTLGHPIQIKRAQDHVFGVVLLNDWSARDIQAWEYQPLGPFLAKNFATTISPWVVTMDALAPFHAPAWPRDAGDPQPLPYLNDPNDASHGHLDIQVNMSIRSAQMRQQKLPAQSLSLASYRTSYWTPAQLITHHTSGGCNLQTGDLIGTGTISGPQRGEEGALLEITQGGKQPVTLSSGETRTFVSDGDELILQGQCTREGAVSIGFGSATARITPASTR